MYSDITDHITTLDVDGNAVIRQMLDDDTDGVCDTILNHSGAKDYLSAEILDEAGLKTKELVEQLDSISHRLDLVLRAQERMIVKIDKIHGLADAIHTVERCNKGGY